MKIKPVISTLVLGAVIFSGLAAAPSADASTYTPSKVTHQKCSPLKDPRGYIWSGSCYWWPGYDTDTSGTRQSYNPRLADAWESFDALQSPPFFDDTHVIAYVSTSHKRPRPRHGYFSILDINARHTWITFKYVKPRHH